MSAFEDWIDVQYRRSAAGLLRSISPITIIKTRPGFGQIIRPHRGAIVASPVLGAYDPDPDYFFHWFRDSAIVIDALRLLFEDGTVGAEALLHLSDFVRFSRALEILDGRTCAHAPGWRAQVLPDFERYLRSDEELEAVRGDRVLADTRVNPDASLDISKWARPQNDGAPLRALTLLRWRQTLQLRSASALPADLQAQLGALLCSDLAFTRHHAREPCFDIWEEENGQHYFTLLVSAAALHQGAEFLQERQDTADAQACRAEASAILELLDSYWLPQQGYYRSRVLPGGTRSAKELDIAVILAAVHAAESGPRHSVHDARMHATLARLEELFRAEYPINHSRPAEQAAALGRYPDDRYYSGGAYYFATLGAAEFSFRAALSASDASRLRVRGDAFLQTVRAFTPTTGELSEQFDRSNGQQTSAKELAWSYAAFISCIAARRAAAAA
jgi:glucoamylase